MADGHQTDRDSCEWRCTSIECSCWCCSDGGVRGNSQEAWQEKDEASAQHNDYEKEAMRKGDWDPNEVEAPCSQLNAKAGREWWSKGQSSTDRDSRGLLRLRVRSWRCPTRWRKDIMAVACGVAERLRAAAASILQGQSKMWRWQVGACCNQNKNRWAWGRLKLKTAMQWYGLVLIGVMYGLSVTAAFPVSRPG